MTAGRQTTRKSARKSARRPRQPWGWWQGRPQQLIERYADAGRTAREAGEALGVTKAAVIARANRTGVQFEPLPETMSALGVKAGLASAAARRARALEACG
jgi:hypothetical protein